MASDFYSSGQLNTNNQVFRESPYKFTEPVRYFKENDPYYWEVDNIPIKQLEENIKWLRDQISTSTDLSGIGREQLTELQPYATGGNRTVKVRKGRYTSRINDAYKKGISSIAKEAFATVANYTNGKISFNITDETIRIIAGETITQLIENNGLYDHLQHHSSNPYTSGGVLDWRTGEGTFTQNTETGINNLPKNKLALYKQSSTAKNYGTQALDLQQLSVEFTRRWGGVARTAIVNVANDLEIEIPSFEDDDYINNSNYVPAVRVDLVFIYSHPIDASATTLVKPNGSSPTTITSPQLGVLKGAGVISLNGEGPDFDGYDLSGGTDFLNSTTYANGKDEVTNYFSSEGARDENGNLQIAAVIGDLNNEVLGMSGIAANFPSPDDLLNLSPLLQQNLERENMALIGQTIMPVAYVVVRKGATTITNSDIIDIRPFFRTTELSYNERAGITAANPPLSFANPVVGKAELAKTVDELKAYFAVDAPAIEPRVVGTGLILGGMYYGVEGGLVRIGGHNQNTGLINPLSQADRLNWLKTECHIPDTASNVPDYPDWDIAPWALSLQSAGNYRNDRIWYARYDSDKNLFEYASDSSLDSTVVKKLSNSLSSRYGKDVGHMFYFVRKRILLDRSQVSWMNYYDVNVELVNCSPAATTDMMSNHSSNANSSVWQQFTGIHVDKDPYGFTIYVAFASSDPHKGSNDDAHPPGKGTLGLNSGLVIRDAETFSGFSVTHRYNTIIQGATMNLTTDEASLPPILVTYPTVQFTITGYPSTFPIRTNLSTPNAVVQLS